MSAHTGEKTSWNGRIIAQIKEAKLKTAFPLKNKHLLEDPFIYQHLKALNNQPQEIKARYTDYDPAIFQKALDEKQRSSVEETTNCLEKAAILGNLALVQSIIQTTADAQKVYPMEKIMEFAIQSKSVALVKYLRELPKPPAPPSPTEENPLPSAALLTEVAGRSGSPVHVSTGAEEAGSQQPTPEEVTLVDGPL